MLLPWDSEYDIIRLVLNSNRGITSIAYSILTLLCEKQETELFLLFLYEWLFLYI